MKPVEIDNFKKLYPSEITYTSSAKLALEDADICFIFTEWEEIKQVTVDDFKSLMKAPIVFDGRNIYELDKM